MYILEKEAVTMQWNRVKQLYRTCMPEICNRCFKDQTYTELQKHVNERRFVLNQSQNLQLHDEYYLQIKIIITLSNSISSAQKQYKLYTTEKPSLQLHSQREFKAYTIFLRQKKCQVWKEVVIPNFNSLKFCHQKF